MRTKPLDECLSNVVRAPNGSLFLCYEPGNGTRYHLTVTPPVSTERIDGVAPDSCLVTLLHWQGSSGVSAFFRAGSGHLAHEYVMKKLGLNEEDGRVITELLGHILMRETEPAGPPEPEPEKVVLFLMPMVKE